MAAKETQKVVLGTGKWTNVGETNKDKVIENISKIEVIFFLGDTPPTEIEGHRLPATDRPIVERRETVPEDTKLWCASSDSRKAAYVVVSQ